MRFPVAVAVVVGMCFGIAASRSADEPGSKKTPVMEPGPKSPAESLKCLKPRPGFVVELMAAEPLVQDPVAFAWGADGKFWVVEMGDYPLGVDGKNKFGGRIKFLEKTKASGGRQPPGGDDGPYNKATVFLDNLGYPTGVTPWGKGVLVTCAPDIFYAEDTDGDGKADKKVVLYTGFREGNQQHRVNGLVWGLDNWLYGANGDSGGTVKSLKTGQAVNISGRDFRIKPDEGLIEAVSGQTQFGRARDDWGNLFGNNNSNPMFHYVLEDRYLKRNPHLLPPDVRVQVSEKPGAAPVYPISKTLPRFNSPQAVNHFTSACSAIVYRDDLFGPDFANNTFVSEPVHNLIHREIMTPKGVTFTSKRAADEQESEFLASTDNWFRPTTIQTGPDGALWVADMYRYVIEHPEWIPKDWQKKLDLRAGHDMGRIYRIYPEGKKPRALPRMDKMTISDLVEALTSPNGWTRDMAQHLLIPHFASIDFSKGPLTPKSIILCEALLDHRKIESPMARMHAWCILETSYDLGSAALRGTALSAETFLRGMRDRTFFGLLTERNAGLRRQGIRVLEKWVNENDQLGPFLLKFLDDSDPQVRLQLACTLGEWKDPRAGKGLGHLLAANSGDRYLMAAALSSVNANNWETMLQGVQESYRNKALPANLIEPLLRLAQGFGNLRGMATLLATLADPGKGQFTPDQFFTLDGLLETLEQKKSSLSKLWNEGDDDLRSSLKKLQGIFDVARKVALDPKAALGDRAMAIRLLGRGLDQQQEDVKSLAGLLSPQTADDLQAAAVQHLGRLGHADVPALLLKPWKGYDPGLRNQVLDVLLGRGEGTGAVLAALEKKDLLALEVDAIRRQRLLDNKDQAVRAGAAKIFAGSINADRAKVVEAYRPALALAGEVARGKKVFEKTCAACHQLAGIGQQVGPDLAAVGDKSPEGLLVATLDPNRAVEARYVGYVATTKAGVTLSGLLAAETSTSITLVAADGKKHSILRTDLEELFSTGKSAMPEGLEKDLPPQDLADLITYIRGNLPNLKPKQFAGNNPAPVKADASGALRLLPQNAAIFGKTLVLEKQYGNLGHWSSADDQAVWTVLVPKAGTYAVEMEWACANESAGNTFILSAASWQLTAKAKGTSGTWDEYRRAVVGTMVLPAGKIEVTMRGQTIMRGSLIDLKEIRLIPQ